MKILFLCRLFYPHIGGVEKHVMEISEILIKKGHEVIVITEQLEDTSLKEKKEGITIYRIPGGGDDWFKKFRIWKGMWNLRDMIKDVDVVHCHDIFFWYLPFRFLFPRRPIYSTFHGFEKFPIPRKAIIVRKLSEKLSFGNICIGGYLSHWYGTKADYIMYGAIKKHDVITSGTSRKIRIGFVGRLAIDNCMPVYIKAVKLLKKRKINYQFEVFGDGELRKEVEKYGKVYGFVSQPEEIMKKVDIIFSASYLGTMEAFQNKKYVISVFDDALKEYVLNTVPWKDWITITDDPEKVCTTIIDIHKNPSKYKAKIEFSYKWVQTQTWDNAVNIYLKLWEKK